MSTTLRFPLVVVAVLATAVSAARADENMLRGPHPFRRDNELSAHVLIAAGGADTPNGGKLALDYGYKLQGLAWLNLQLNWQHASCQSLSGVNNVCSSPAGSLYETLVGAKLKWPTAIPIVPYVKGAVGLAFSFPNGKSNGWGMAARVGGGASYFIFDWLGLGLEIGYSAGYLTTASPTYTVLDFGGGLEFQF